MDFLAKLTDADRVLAERAFEYGPPFPPTNIIGRQRVGRLFDAMLANAEYTAEMVDELTRRSGLKRGTLFDARAVARAWSEDRLRELLRDTEANGVRLTWSVLVAISRTAPGTREELTERLRREQIHVRDV